MGRTPGAEAQTGNAMVRGVPVQGRGQGRGSNNRQFVKLGGSFSLLAARNAGELPQGAFSTQVSGRTAEGIGVRLVSTFLAPCGALRLIPNQRDGRGGGTGLTRTPKLATKNTENSKREKDLVNLSIGLMLALAVPRQFLLSVFFAFFVAIPFRNSG